MRCADVVVSAYWPSGLKVGGWKPGHCHCVVYSDKEHCSTLSLSTYNKLHVGE